MLSDAILNVVMLSVILLCAVVLGLSLPSDLMLCVVVLEVFMLSVVTPFCLVSPC
jgi:hypothetical protein